MHLEFKISPITEAYEEIYFANNHGHYLKSPETKGFFVKSIVALLVTLLSVGISLFIGSSNFNSSPTILLLFLMLLFCIGQIMTIIFLLGFVQKALELKKWKKQVAEFLKTLTSTTIYKIIITDSSLTIVQNDVEKIINWSSILKAEITNEYISFTCHENFLIPSKCIEPDAYPKLREALSEKLKNTTT